MKEIKEVAAAIDKQNYKQASKLLKELQQSMPESPWVKLYVAIFYEKVDKLETAEKLYRKLLPTVNNPQIIAQARQGLQRIENIEKQRQAEAIAQAKSLPENTEPGLLILEPIAKEEKVTAAQTLARIMKIDPYSARMQVQNRGWRIYKTGAIGELQVYGQEMLAGNIPVFWARLSAMEQINIFRVEYLQNIDENHQQVNLVCLNANDQRGSLTFSWSEVTAKVDGALPMFMETMDYDPRRNRNDRFRKREIVQDYAQIFDLHLSHRNSILRFCDRQYQFAQGIDFTENATANSADNAPNVTNTIRVKWNNLNETVKSQLSQAVNFNDFNAFAEPTTQDYPQLLSRLHCQINLERKLDSAWDPAFHLYSCLAFMKNQQQN